MKWTVRFFVMMAITTLSLGCSSPGSQWGRPSHSRQTAFSLVSHPAVHPTYGGSQPGSSRAPKHPLVIGEYPVEFFLAMAVERNPEIQAARAEYSAQAQVIPQVTALDDPMLSSILWPLWQNAPQTAMGRMPLSLMLSQNYPWKGKLELQGQVAALEAQMARAQWAQAELKVFEAVQLAYYDIQFYQRALDIYQENLLLLEDLLEITEARYRTAATSQQDVLRSQVEIDLLEERLIELEQSLEWARADLVRLVVADSSSQPEAEPDFRPVAVPQELDRLVEIAMNCRPELQQRLSAIMRDRTNKCLKELDYYPDFTLGMGWDLMTDRRALAPTADGIDNLSLSVGFNLPVRKARLRAGVSEAHQRLIQSARLYDAERDETLRQIRRAIVQIQALDDQLQLYQNRLIPNSQQTFDISLADYQGGRVTFVQVIDNWAQWLEFRLQQARLQASLQQSLASLDRIIGCTITDLEVGEIQP